jgi:RsiW-degrading membrane proteinase PrsW (M82 family)
MQNIDLSFAQDPNTLTLALIAGLIPALLWLFFWIREQRAEPHRSSGLFWAFLAGAFMVVLALPVEHGIAAISNDPTVLTALWATAEELLKFGAFLAILFWTESVALPADYAVYSIVVALGFAGFENALYFLQPLQTGTTNVLLLAGSMRFLGSTLMHAIASSLPGIALGFAFFKSKKTNLVFACIGLAGSAIAHSVFNLAIVDTPNMEFFIIIAVLWLAAIIALSLIERLREQGSDESLRQRKSAYLSSLESVFGRLTIRAGMNANDPKPLVEGLRARGIPEGDGDYADLSRLIASLRYTYGEFLVGEGAMPEGAALSAAKLISDTVSPEAISGIFAVLKK